MNTLKNILFLILLPFLVQSQVSSLKVMTLNARYNNPDDGPYSWVNRKSMFFDMIQQVNPDVIGFQETLISQVLDLQEAFPGYSWVGAGRDDGKQAGEFAPIFFNARRFEQKATGTFWLSETPDKPGSRSWNAACNRIVTWIKLSDLESHQLFFVFNTHFDHASAEARIQSARLINSTIKKIAGKCWVIVTGDFNDTEGSEMYEILTDTLQKNTLTNTSRISTAKPDGPSYTYIGFPFHPEEGNTIDFIFTKNSQSVKVVSHQVLTYNHEGKYPSDHLPVYATFELKKK